MDGTLAQLLSSTPKESHMHLRARLISIGATALAAIPFMVFGPASEASHAAALPARATTHSCATPMAGSASCKAVVRTDVKGQLSPAATPSGFGPASLQSAYNLPSSTAGSGRTVAIVDAYDDPTAEADLAVY